MGLVGLARSFLSLLGKPGAKAQTKHHEVPVEEASGLPQVGLRTFCARWR